jgi:hypothetical protein
MRNDGAEYPQTSWKGRRALVKGKNCEKEIFMQKICLQFFFFAVKYNRVIVSATPHATLYGGALNNYANDIDIQYGRKHFGGNIFIGTDDGEPFGQEEVGACARLRRCERHGAFGRFEGV